MKFVAETERFAVEDPVLHYARRTDTLKLREPIGVFLVQYTDPTITQPEHWCAGSPLSWGTVYVT